MNESGGKVKELQNTDQKTITKYIFKNYIQTLKKKKLPRK